MGYDYKAEARRIVEGLYRGIASASDEDVRYVELALRRAAEERDRQWQGALGPKWAGVTPDMTDPMTVFGIALQVVVDATDRERKERDAAWLCALIETAQPGDSPMIVAERAMKRAAEEAEVRAFGDRGAVPQDRDGRAGAPPGRRAEGTGRAGV